jgi:hypothetical protein
MKTIIKKIVFVRLRNEAFLEFFIVVLNLLDKFTEVKALVGTFYPQLVELVAQVKKLVDAAQSSSYTQQLADADARVDNDIVGIKAAVTSALHHFDLAVRAAAKIVAKRMKDYGNIKDKSYEEESAAVQLLLADFKGALAADVLTLKLTEWVAELEAAEAAFTELFELRNVELAGRPQESLRAVRHKTVELFGQTTYVINADVMLNGEAVCGEFVRQLNEQIKYFSEHAHRPSKRDLQSATVDSIPDQPFAGKAVTPIPTVRYTTSKGDALELTFAKDFTVTYKNNDRVGNVAMTIHGKGEYKGVKGVTFNVV